jgi:hypothetical protein
LAKTLSPRRLALFGQLPSMWVVEWPGKILGDLGDQVFVSFVVDHLDFIE